MSSTHTPAIPLRISTGRPVRTLSFWFGLILLGLAVLIVVVPLPPLVLASIAVITTILTVVFAIAAVGLAHTADR